MKESLVRNQFVVLATITTLCIWLAFMLINLNAPLLGAYNFRQTQTAITTYWMIQEGFRLDYLTPVLGPGWSIPMEFPTYQGLVAILCSWFNLPIDETGRVVNFLFFFAMLIPLYLFLLSRGVEKRAALIPLCFVLLSPFYLYWSRTFMIESTSVFFGVMTIYLFHRHLIEKRKLLLLIVCALGTVSALTKITSYAVILAFLCFLTLEAMWLNRKSFRLFSYAAVSGLLIFLVPVSFAVLWNSYADSVKATVPLADFILSDNLSVFNFGTFEQRFSVDTWQKYSQYIDKLIGMSPFLIVGCLGFSHERLRWLSLACIVTFLAGPMAFTNLYFRHEYYFYANGIFAIMFFSIGLITLYEKKHKFALIAISITTLASFIYSYTSHYPKLLDYEYKNPSYQVSKLIKENTHSTDVVLIYNGNWNSSIAYYAERKAIMDRQDKPISELSKQGVLDDLTIGSLVLCGDHRLENSFKQPRIEFLGLDKNTRLGAWNCELYFKNKD